MSDRPRDIHGNEVELGAWYWARSSVGKVHAGKFLNRSEGEIQFRAGSSIAGASSWDAWEFVRAIPPSFDAQPPAGTVRVRIVCGVSSDRKWAAEGSSDQDDEESLRWLRGSMEVCERDYSVQWVEADLVVPVPITVEGSVSQ